MSSSPYLELVGGELIEDTMRYQLASDPILSDDVERLNEQLSGIRWRAEVANGYVHFERWRIVKTTPEGFWIEPDEDIVIGTRKKTWRSKKTRFCAETRREALMQLLQRKRAYVRHAKLRYVEARTQKEVARRAWEQGRGATP